jgi:hypothetical protein
MLDSDLAAFYGVTIRELMSPLPEPKRRGIGFTATRAARKSSPSPITSTACYLQRTQEV